MSRFKSWTDQVAKSEDTAQSVVADLEIRYTGSWEDGFVWVESKAVDESVYTEVPGTKHAIPTKFNLTVNDTSVMYRFACQNISGTVNCYMGP